MCCYSPPPKYARTCIRTYCVFPVFWPGLLTVLREEQQIVIYCTAICLTAAALRVVFYSVVILMNSLFFVNSMCAFSPQYESVSNISGVGTCRAL